MKRLVIATLLGLSIFGMTLGLTTSLAVNADQLASGTSATVSGCDDAVDVAFGLTPGDLATVSSLEISGIAATCEGQTVHVVATDGTATAIEQATAPAGGVVSVPLTTPLSAADLQTVAVTITG